MELGVVDSISRETAGRTLKNNGFSKRKVQSWVIPSHADAEFAANMEEVPETCEPPYYAQQPVVCMDTRESVSATENHPQGVEYEYERAGTAVVFMFCVPLSGWRQATACERHTKTDWAHELVLDNLNTHTKGAFYAAFEPEQARELVRRIDFYYTPKSHDRAAAHPDGMKSGGPVLEARVECVVNCP